MMKNKDQVKIFTRRAFVIGGLQGALLGVLGGRLAWLQVAQGSRYKTLSDKNRISLKILAPERGQIVDRFGVPLAVNAQNFRALIVPEQAKSIKDSLIALKQHIDITDDDIIRALKQAKKSAKYVPIEVKDSLSWKDIATIEVNLPDLPGISTDDGERRSYPFAEATAHLIGYVGAVSEKDLDKAKQNKDIEDMPVLKLPGFKIGKTGIEKSFEKQLRGQGGRAEIEVNVIGRQVRELSKQESVEGQRITLTIDGELQRFAQERLSQETSASAVVMDAHSGAVYALASYPAFNPNVFTSGIPTALWKELNADIAHPLTNKALSGQYPPASTFKMVTLLAALQSGKTNPKRRVTCNGVYYFGNTKFHCWKKEGHGSVDAKTALQVSCDTYFYDVAKDVGIEQIAKTARSMGLGSKLGFELAQERSGLIPDKEWKLAATGEKWQAGETIVSSIGQGFIQTTPLQLATMTARLVNGGYAVMPWVTADGLANNIMPPGGWPKMVLDPEHLALIKAGMDSVVNDWRGTARRSKPEEEEYAFGGKTGTAQVKRITREQRLKGVKNEDLDWESRHHALFVGYAPLENPRYICSVVVEHGIGGSRAAAPIARDLLVEVQKRNPGATAINTKGVEMYKNRDFGPNTPEKKRGPA